MDEPFILEEDCLGWRNFIQPSAGYKLLCFLDHFSQRLNLSLFLTNGSPFVTNENISDLFHRAFCEGEHERCCETSCLYFHFTDGKMNVRTSNLSTVTKRNLWYRKIKHESPHHFPLDSPCSCAYSNRWTHYDAEGADWAWEYNPFFFFYNQVKLVFLLMEASPKDITCNSPFVLCTDRNYITQIAAVCQYIFFERKSFFSIKLFKWRLSPFLIQPRLLTWNSDCHLLINNKLNSYITVYFQLTVYLMVAAYLRAEMWNEGILEQWKFSCLSCHQLPDLWIIPRNQI